MTDRVVNVHDIRRQLIRTENANPKDVSARKRTPMYGKCHRCEKMFERVLPLTATICNGCARRIQTAGGDIKNAKILMKGHKPVLCQNCGRHIQELQFKHYANFAVCPKCLWHMQHSIYAHGRNRAKD